MYKYLGALFIIQLCIGCDTKSDKDIIAEAQTNNVNSHRSNHVAYDTSITVIHLFVALCDNQYQGIVPVPAAIGNGDDPSNNLYWGCGYGVRTYFKSSSQWTLIKNYPVDTTILERLIFKSKKANAYIIADAYRGRYIQQCTTDFLQSCAGQLKDTININGVIIGTQGNAKLLAYIGHNGMMDFKLAGSFNNADGLKRDAIILACISRNYFYDLLSSTKAYPLVWTTGLMCPEAYTLHDALESYLNDEPAEIVRNSAAAAYSKYQKCSINAAKNLLVSGW